MAHKRKLNANGVNLYGQYVKRSKKKKLTFDLSKEEFLALTQADCYICGAKPSQRYIQSYRRPSLAKNPYIYNGIDRVLNDQGYEMGNVLPCCGTCNHAKKEQSINDFLQYIHRCYKFAVEPYLPKGTNNA